MISKDRPLRDSKNLLEQLSKILSFSTSKTRRETIKQKRSRNRNKKY